MVDIDLHERRMDLVVDGEVAGESVFEARRESGKYARTARDFGPLLRLYARTVGPTARGAVMGDRESSDDRIARDSIIKEE